MSGVADSDPVYKNGMVPSSTSSTEPMFGGRRRRSRRGKSRRSRKGPKRSRKSKGMKKSRKSRRR